MSFFADIIADSRRKIVPEHRSDHLSGLMPVQANPTGSELVWDRVTGIDAGKGNDDNHKVMQTTEPETAASVTPARSQTSPTKISAPPISSNGRDG